MKIGVQDIVECFMAGITMGCFLILFGYLGAYVSMAIAFLSAGLLISGIWLGRRAVLWGLAGIVQFLLVLIWIRM